MYYNRILIGKVAMKFPMLLAVLVFALCGVTVAAGESHYEVYYFHASWRCTNCNNAEAWTGEVVAAIQAENPDVTVRFAPTQLETNKQLVSMMKAKRVDVAVAEVRDGKIIRHKNLGNILQLVGSQPTLMQHVMDGVVDFSKQSKGAGVLNAPRGGSAMRQAAPSNKRLAVYVVQTSNAGQNQRVGGMLANAISQSFPQLAQSGKVDVSFIDPKARDNAGWLSHVKARPGDVVVALLGDGGMEVFNALPGPTDQSQETGFMNSFVGIVRQYAGNL